MKPLEQCRLYAFVDMAYLNGRAPEKIAEQLCAGGADLLQLRAKDSTPDEIRAMARALRRLTREANVGLVINDYPEIAREVDADFYHLGQEDFFESRRRPGKPQKAAAPAGVTEPGLGLSTHSPDDARRAMAARADYLAVGPVFSTATKPTAIPVTLEYLRWAAENISVPWFAIGGINLDNLDAVRAAGAQRVCMVSAILNSPDIAATCREVLERLG